MDVKKVEPTKEGYGEGSFVGIQRITSRICQRFALPKTNLRLASYVRRTLCEMLLMEEKEVVSMLVFSDY